MYSQYRESAHSSSDINDYYDQVPPAHRLSSLSTTQLNVGSSANLTAEPYSDAPLRTRPHFGDRRGEFDNTPSTEEKTPRNNRRRWIIGGLAAVGLLVVVAIVIGVVVSQLKKEKSSGSNSSSKAITGNPSQFQKDSRLKQSFYGIAYSPGNPFPDCGIELADVVTDMQLLSQLTTRIRLYGADCNATALVLEAIKLTQVNMTVFIANYPEATDNGTAYNRQKSAIEDAIKTYGTDHIGGVTVGNEFILDFLNANNGGDDPNGAVGNQGASILVPFIDDTKSMLQSLGVSLKVGNADAGSFFNNKVLGDVDYGMANVHPWFANESIDDAAGWTWSFFEQTDVALAQELTNTPQMSIAETGWPTKSSDVGNESNGPSTASEENLQKFLDTFVCQANANGTAYFMFEFCDEPWKDKEFGGVESWWGLFNSNRTLKNINIPDC
ncbi:glycoside hydrolase family 17 protein [Collybiopsis luxurians FD-317 M1]|nr:glycoside hydrolase family 17 protein [Collybiopsis luxurians FD-317 M1]